MVHVRFIRSELLTEVVKDTEVMPADPSENLPLAQLHVPLLLNGRPTAPTTAAAAAAASLQRRRQQQQAAAAAAAAAQQQQQLLAAAAAAHAAAARQEEYKQDMADLTGGCCAGRRPVQTSCVLVLTLCTVRGVIRPQDDGWFASL